jgi:hypothetical protein
MCDCSQLSVCLSVCLSRKVVLMCHYVCPSVHPSDKAWHGVWVTESQHHHARPPTFFHSDPRAIQQSGCGKILVIECVCAQARCTTHMQVTPILRLYGLSCRPTQHNLWRYLVQNLKLCNTTKSRCSFEQEVPLSAMHNNSSTVTRV